MRRVSGTPLGYAHAARPLTPEFGIRLSSYEAVLLGMTLNAGAYLTEIQRAGFASVRPSEIEAAETLGMSRAQIVRYVIVPHIMKVLFPPLSSPLARLGARLEAWLAAARSRRRH